MKVIRSIFKVISACLMIAVVTMLFACSVVSDRVHTLSSRETAGFCTLNDEVYLTLVSEHATWIETFRSRSEATQLGSRTLMFAAPSGQEYTVSARFWDIWDDDSSPVLVISVVGWSWQGILGSAGYIYSPTGRLTESNDEYEVNHLSGDIYCYRLR